MQKFEVTQTATGFETHGIPDAVCIVKITEKLGNRLSDLLLHQSDLEFSIGCLEAINRTTEQIIREALWRSAIIHFIKCFGDGARFLLQPNQIYKSHPPEAREAFIYFKNLRNKHIAHDENSYAQAIPGAAINDGSKPYSIEKITCFQAIAVTLEQDNWNNLHTLANTAHTWCTTEFDTVCDKLTSQLEAIPYSDLKKRPPLTFTPGGLDEVGKSRKSR